MHITSAEPNYFRQWSKTRLRALEAPRVVLMLSRAVWALFLSILIRNWIKKNNGWSIFFWGGACYAPLGSATARIHRLQPLTRQNPHLHLNPDLLLLGRLLQVLGPVFILITLFFSRKVRTELLYCTPGHFNNIMGAIGVGDGGGGGGHCPPKKKNGSQKFGQNAGRIRAKFGAKVEEKNSGKFTGKERKICCISKSMKLFENNLQELARFFV